MNTDIVLFTVPHSGTRFTLEYLNRLGFRRWNVNLDKLRRITDVGVLFHQQHTGPWLGQQISDPEQHLENKKVIITVRHPHLVLNSFLARGKTLETNVACWKSLLEWLPRTDHCIFDIGCAESKRFRQMYGLMEHIGQNNLDTYRITKDYVDEWEPINVTPSKDIEVNDYSELDFAVEWYQNLPTN